MGGTELKQRNDFDLYDLQNEKKRRNHSPVTRSIFILIFFCENKISSERLEKAANKESVLKCLMQTHIFGSSANQRIVSGSSQFSTSKVKNN